MAIISSVYSFLTNVEMIKVIPDANQIYSDTSSTEWRVKGGISCVPTGTGADYAYCNTVTDEMFNALTDNVQWTCELYTDYSDKPFFESFIFKFSSFTIYMTILITFVLFYGIFSTIHDCTLANYKSRLDLVSFFPDHQTWDDFKLSYTLWNMCICYCGGCTCLGYIWVLIIVWPLLICIILDMLYIHIIWPIIVLIQSSYYNKQQQHKIHTISYISAEWVGISCYTMCAATLQQMSYISNGFSFDIPSKDPSQCSCSCNYIFTESDYYKLLFTTFIFVVLTMNFLYSWTMETFHGNHYLYLIKYSLSIEQAHRINPEECTGSMLINLEDSTKNHNNDNKLIDDQSMKIDELESQEIDSEEEKEDIQPFIINKEKNDVEQFLTEEGLYYSSRNMHGSLTTGIVRAIIFITAASTFVLTIGYILLTQFRNNFYDYPTWAQILAYIVYVIVLLFWVVVYGGLSYYFVKLLIPRIAKYLEDKWELEHSDDDSVDSEQISVNQ
eukprot:326153_1